MGANPGVSWLMAAAGERAVVRRRDEQVAGRRESRDGNGVPRGRPVYGREHEISQVSRAGLPAKACRDVGEHQRHGGIHRGGAREIRSRKRESEQRQCRCSQGKKEQVAQPSTPGLFDRRRRAEGERR